jgi:hypothetical protein
MQFKYFKITAQASLDAIELALQSIEVRDLAVKCLADKLGAYDCLQFSDGGIAAFKFKSAPDKAKWKKSKYGFLPKAKTDEQKMMVSLPRLLDWKEVIKRYGFGHEMIIGDRVPNGTAFRMHSSYLKGNRKSSFYAIVVPYSGDFEKEVHQSLVELKEWEILKAIDEGE